MSVTLRRWRRGDDALLREGAADPYVAKIERLAEPDALASRIADARSWVVELDGEAVGGVGVGEERIPGLVNVGYWIVERARGRGAATAALLDATQRLFADGVERVQAVVEPWNEPSRRVLAAAGFRYEGLLRGFAAWPGEPRHDVYLYARLVGD